jgi:hypothetical protein
MVRSRRQVTAAQRTLASLLLSAAACLPACSFEAAALDGGVHRDGTGAEQQLDALHDAPGDTLVPDAIDAGPCAGWSALDVDPCAAALGTPADLTIGAGTYTLDTTSGTLTGSTTIPLRTAMVEQASGSGQQVLVVNATQLTVSSNATITVVGSVPLVFVVHGNVTFAGDLSASGATGSAGPGAGSAGDCGAGLGTPGVASTGTGGGGGAGGGGFADVGGDSGMGGGPGGGSKAGHGGGNGMPTLVPLRGGCSGGTGGATSLAVAGGGGGGGGGAIEITAAGAILVSGTLRARGGGGGTPILLNGGGGGGGTGGAILLDGDSISVTGSLCANGGGGGEGGAIGVATTPGADGTCTTVPAAGGTGTAGAGDGGAGGGGNAVKGVNGGDGTGGSLAGGGGGGGSEGRIRLHGRTTMATFGGATVTPAPVTP